MNSINGIKIFGPTDQGALEQIKRCALDDRVIACSLMADHHKGYAVPIGGVIAYDDAISPSGVGFDIGCGNKAVRLDIDYKYVKFNIDRIMRNVITNISFGIGQKNNVKVDHELFDDDPAWSLPQVRQLKDVARNQLGTVGSGNHYVDIFADELCRVWIGVHFGSRGLGHKIATYFLNAAGAKDGMDVEPCVLDVHSSLGEDYLTAMALCGRYAYAGRDWVCSRVAELLGGKIVEEVHNHHNFAWREYFYGKKIWVVRKGATPNYPGIRSFIGGTMAEPSYIIEGCESLINRDTIQSTVHGAGRVMSRTAARGKIRRRTVWQCGQRDCDGSHRVSDVKRGEDGSNPKCPRCGSKTNKRHIEEQISPGSVTKDMMDDWLRASEVVLYGGGLDESPHCYKRLTEVLKEHGDSVKIIHCLTPMGVAMAGENEFDPYKD